jgi:hypothetical protein
MQPSQQELRLRFEAETDIVVNQKTKDWRAYALWLENLNIKKINDELVQENEKLRNAFYEAMDILEVGLVSRADG